MWKLGFGGSNCISMPRVGTNDKQYLNPWFQKQPFPVNAVAATKFITEESLERVPAPRCAPQTLTSLKDLPSSTVTPSLSAKASFRQWLLGMTKVCWVPVRPSTHQGTKFPFQGMVKQTNIQLLSVEEDRSYKLTGRRNGIVSYRESSLKRTEQV